VIAQQHRSHAGAVDEEIAWNRPAGFGTECRDIAVFVRLDGGYPVLDVTHTQRVGAVSGQQFGEFPCIEVVGVIQYAGIFRRLRLLGAEVPVAHHALRTDGVGERPFAAGVQPQRGQVIVRIACRRREGMVIDIRPATVDPADKTCALLEAGGALPDERCFGNADAFQGGAHGWPGTLADPDGGDLRRLHQRDGHVAAGLLGMPCGNQPGRDPSGASATNHDDSFC
jgi:hypothetical protein